MEKKLQKIENNFHAWKRRNLTFEGKVLLVKSLGISVAGYEIQMTGIPERYVKQVKDKLWSFLWGSKTPLINKESACLPKLEGGLGMLNIENFIKIKQIKLIEEIKNSEPQEWNALAKHWLKILDENNSINMLITKVSDLRYIDLKQMPIFYQKAVRSWTELQQHRKVSTKADILNENLFCNNFIQTNRRPVFLKHWIQDKIIKIKHIWDEKEKTWIAERQIMNKLSKKNRWMTELLMIRQAIPTAWITVLKDDSAVDAANAPDLIINEQGEILINSKSIKKSTNKNILKVLQENNKKKTPCIKYWNEKLEKELPWEHIWKNLKLSKCNNNVKQFQWKSIHNVLNTNVRLKKMKKGNGTCPVCQRDQEDQIHLFFLCRNIQTVIAKMNEKIKEIKQNLTINVENIIFGFDKSLTEVENRKFSSIIYIFKWEIWKNRNKAIFEKKYDPAEIVIRKILSELPPSL